MCTRFTLLFSLFTFPLGHLLFSRIVRRFSLLFCVLPLIYALPLFPFITLYNILKIILIDERFNQEAEPITRNFSLVRFFIFIVRFRQEWKSFVRMRGYVRTMNVISKNRLKIEEIMMAVRISLVFFLLLYCNGHCLHP